MNVVTIAIGDLFDFEGQMPPAIRRNGETITAMVKRQFAFHQARRDRVTSIARLAANEED